MGTQKDIFDNELQIDAEARQQLKGMATWAMVIVVSSVLGYVISITDTIVSPDYEIGAMKEGFASSLAFGKKSLGGAIFSTVVGLIIHFFLFRFSTLTGEALKTLDQDKTAAAFRNLKIYLAITAVISVLGGLGVLIALVAII